MAIKRVTVSLPEELAAKLRSEAGGRSVSAYVADLISEHFDESEVERLWRSYLDEVAITSEDIATADEILNKLTARPATDAA